MKKIVLFFLLIFFFPGSFLIAQQVLKMPVKYERPREYIEPITVGEKTFFYQPPRIDDERNEQWNWYVWSDRDNNVTYTTHNGSTVKETLGFMQPLAVLDISGDRLLVARKEDIENDRLPAGRPDMGWIDHDRLLLWQRSLQSREFFIEKKTMIINVFDPANPGQDIPHLYYAPPGESEIRSSAGEVRNYEIRLVYKETENDFLVGRRFFINTRGQTNAQDVIDGWVSKGQSTPWNHRTGVEWDWTTTMDRINSGNPATVWEESDNIPVGAHFARESEANPYVERVPGPFNRYPILDVVDQDEIDKNRPVRIGYVGSIFSEDIGQIPDDFIVELQKATAEITQRLRNINIIFVIDATLSMEIYAEPVAEALDRVMQGIYEREELRSQQTQKTYRFGALLFRDEPEEYIIHYSNRGELTQDTDIINDFLNEYMVPKYNDLSRDLPESMYYGIEQAMQIFEPNPAQTNYAIIIGDAGDHQNPVGKPRTFRTAEAVIEELAAVNTNVIAYQVFHNQRTHSTTGMMLPADTIYETFQTQLKHLIKETARSIIKGEEDESMYKAIEWTEREPNRFVLQNPAIMGELIVPNVNDSIPMTLLEEMLVDRINTIDTITNNEIDRLIDYFFRGGGMTADTDRADIERLIYIIIRTLEEQGITDVDFDQARDIIEIIIAGGTRQLYQEGYTLYNFDDTSWFQSVVLMSHDYLFGLVRQIRQLAEIRDYPPQERRETLIRTWDMLIEAFIGQIDEETKNNITADDIQQWLIGVQVEAHWGNVTYRCLHDPHCFSNSDIIEYADTYAEAYDELRSVYDLGAGYSGYIIGSDSQYLWIPATVFP